jgi:hypothetical protein
MPGDRCGETNIGNTKEACDNLSRSPTALFRGTVSLPFFLGLKFAFRDDRDRDVQHLGPPDEERSCLWELL